MNGTTTRRPLNYANPCLSTGRRCVFSLFLLVAGMLLAPAAFFAAERPPGPTVEISFSTEVKGTDRTVSGEVLRQNPDEVVIRTSFNPRRKPAMETVTIPVSSIRQARQGDQVVYDASRFGAVLPTWVGDPSETRATIDGGVLFTKEGLSGGSLWIPDGVKPLRFVVLLALGDPGVRTMVMRQSGAVMTISPKGSREVMERTAELGGTATSGHFWSAWAELRGITDIDASLAHYAKRSGHPELVHLPFIGWGISRGASCVTQLAKSCPERFLGVIGYHGGDGVVFQQAPDLRVPRLNLSEDSIDWFVVGYDRHVAHRRDGYPDAMLYQPGVQHILVCHNDVQFAWAEGVIALRLPPDVSTDRKPVLRAIDPTRQGWLGETLTGRIAATAEYQGKAEDSCWLPDEVTAVLWSRYVVPRAGERSAFALALESGRIIRAAQAKEADALARQRTKEIRRVVVWTNGAADDPRPHVLVVGGHECQSGTGIAWPEQMALAREDWRITSIAAADWTIFDAARETAGRLDALGPVGLVLIFFGNKESADQAWKDRDATNFAQALRDLVVALRAHPTCVAATIAVVTPLPIVQEWLDYWMKLSKSYVRGEEHAQNLIDAFTAVAQELHCPLIDLAKEAGPSPSTRTRGIQETGLRPFIGPSGCFMDDKGHQRMARWMARRIDEQKLLPAPRDPVRLADLLRVRADRDRLAMLVSTTSMGEVDASEALPPTPPPGMGAELVRDAKTRAEMQAARHWNAAYALAPVVLRACAGNFVLSRADDQYAAINLEGSSRPQLMLSCTDKEVVLRDLAKSGVQRIDESRPHLCPSLEETWRRLSPWDEWQRPSPVTGGPAGQRQRILLRFDLSALDLTRVERAEVRVDWVSGIEQKWVTPIQRDGCVQPILNLDRSWVIGKATWKTRDGTIPWTGGCADPVRRRHDLSGFLAGKPQSEVAFLAQALLDRTVCEPPPRSALE